MTIKKTIGGDRLGSGNKMKTSLHAYNRSTHNLSRTWRSSMQVGVLTPCFLEIMTNGDTMDMKIKHRILTAPTNGATFGAFKFQVDIFSGDFRLWNGLLHNNVTKVGTDIKQVKFPQLNLKSTYIPVDECGNNNIDYETHQIASDSLMHYLGVKGMGAAYEDGKIVKGQVSMLTCAMPMFMYYDIFKTYYSNKQEENAYVLCPNSRGSDADLIKNIYQVTVLAADRNTPLDYKVIPADSVIQANLSNPSANSNRIIIPGVTAEEIEGITMTLSTYTGETPGATLEKRLVDITRGGEMIQEGFYTMFDVNLLDRWDLISATGKVEFIGAKRGVTFLNQVDGTSMVPFPLENIDNARMKLLNQKKGEAILITDSAGIGATLPYSAITGTYENSVAGGPVSNNIHHLCGLCVKTYQSDIFNNWLNSDWIIGQNGIEGITNIDISEGFLNLDALSLHQKAYNVLNRIVVAGGTFEDWEEASYGVKAVRRIENPVYQGGASSHIVFNEVLSTGGELPIGTIAGRGETINEKGGKIYFKAHETCYVMGIASITPLIDYSQGNNFFSQITTFEDLHRPGFDRIGYQNLATWKMAWWDRKLPLNTSSTSGGITYSAGKQPAWIDYQTSVNECHGAFAEKNNMMFMTLNRRYEDHSQSGDVLQSTISDLTTYIDPTKYNYIFAVNELEAQNFWVQIGFDVKMRRVMSANQIPNL